MSGYSGFLADAPAISAGMNLSDALGLAVAAAQIHSRAYVSECGRMSLSTVAMGGTTGHFYTALDEAGNEAARVLIEGNAYRIVFRVDGKRVAGPSGTVREGDPCLAEFDAAFRDIVEAKRPRSFRSEPKPGVVAGVDLEEIEGEWSASPYYSFSGRSREPLAPEFLPRFPTRQAALMAAVEAFDRVYLVPRASDPRARVTAMALLRKAVKEWR